MSWPGSVRACRDEIASGAQRFRNVLRVQMENVALHELVRSA
jgi:hypothetical protein